MKKQCLLQCLSFCSVSHQDNNFETDNLVQSKLDKRIALISSEYYENTRYKIISHYKNTFAADNNENRSQQSLYSSYKFEELDRHKNARVSLSKLGTLLYMQNLSSQLLVTFKNTFAAQRRPRLL